MTTRLMAITFRFFVESLDSSEVCEGFEPRGVARSLERAAPPLFLPFFSALRFHPE